MTASGQIKPAHWRLLARAAQVAERGSRRVLVRFLGTTPQSSNLRGLLSNLCRALRDPEAVEKEVPTDLRELQTEFDKHLELRTPDQPIVLFLDSLDRLDELMAPARPIGCAHPASRCEGSDLVYL